MNLKRINGIPERVKEIYSNERYLLLALLLVVIARDLNLASG